MNKVKLCCFTVNYTHACIIVNNFISNELSNVKIVYISEKSQTKKLKSIISKFYSELEDRTYFTEWQNEEIVNDYKKEKFVFVVIGKEKFINSVNKFLDLNEFEGYIINCFDVFDISGKIENVINMHDYYVNTEGIALKENIKR